MSNVFHRMNHIKHVIETDYDSHTDTEKESAALLPLRWSTTMLDILGLPVPVYVEPVPVHGEIDTERKRKTDMWNNGNNGYGQGQGYGYGNVDSVYEEMNRAREQGGARFPFIEAGRHKLALVTLEKFQHRTDGPSVRAIFLVLESNNPKHQPGSFVVKIFKIAKRPKYESSLSDAELLANMAMALKNAPKGHPIGRDLRVLLEERPNEQLARGSIVECTGVAKPKGNWTDLYWSSLPQTPQDIVAMRQRIEAMGVPDTGGQRQQQGYGQPSQGPYAVPQGPQYSQPPQQPYGQPQQLQGYGQSPQQPAPQGPPQGGFLAQLPPNGPQGPQGGGNQGGTW